MILFNFYFNLSIILFVSILLVNSSLEFKQFFDKKVNFNGFDGVIGAFADFDFDRITDVVLIGERGRSIELLKGCSDDKMPFLQKWSNFKCIFPNTSNDKIVGVIAADFTGRDYMDILVVTIEESDTLLNNLFPNYNIWIFKSHQKNIECNTTQPLTKNIRSFPLTLDYNGDMITDFIVETDKCAKELWINLKPFCLEKLSTNQTMKYPNSYAFIDLSNPRDFRPDLFIAGNNYIEYWFDVNDIQILDYPNRTIYQFIGQSTFVDINFDGIIEHILPVCKSDINSCKEPQILVLTKSHSSYEWIEIFENNQKDLTFTQTKVLDYLDFFVTLRAGDIDSDGFPDFVTLMRDQNSNQTKVVLLKNSKSDKNKFGRQFTIETIVDNSVIEGRTPYLATFFDLNEDGQLDVLINSDDYKTHYLNALLNNGKGSSNFLKVFVSSGICLSDCPHISTPLIGPHLCVIPSESEGIGCGGQLSQTQHFALQLPFVLFGLGEIPSYIENLSVSIPSGQMSLRWQYWKEVIPDSQIVIIPYPANNSDEWLQKLYLDPKYSLFPTLITLTTFCCLLVIIIAFLHRRDLRKDIQELKEYKRHWL